MYRPTTCKVIGIGSLGNKVVNRIADSGIHCAELFLIDNEPLNSRESKADKKYLVSIKENIMGSGEQKIEVADMIKECNGEFAGIVDDADWIFIAAETGGNLVKELASFLSKTAKSRRILTIGVIPMPFDRGKDNYEKDLGIQIMTDYCDSLIVFDNDHSHTANNQTVTGETLELTAESAVRCIKDLIYSYYAPDGYYIYLDFADITSIIRRNKGIAHIGFGKAGGENKYKDAVNQALNSQPLESSIASAGGVFIIFKVGAGADLEDDFLDSIMEPVDVIKKEKNYDSELLFSIIFDKSLEDEVDVTVIAFGVDS